MHRIEAQQMRVGLDRPKIVDADHLDVGAAGFGDGAQDIAADAAKPVDRNPDCHLWSPSIAYVAPGKAASPSRSSLRRIARFGPARWKLWRLGSPFLG